MTGHLVNRDVFVHNPSEYSLQNDGVSKVDNTSTIQYELSTFVCEGEYEQGLNRILEAYLAHLDLPTQPSAWVSGFYGSGKSHLVKILEALWANRPLPDGRLPRDVARLPEYIQQHFRTLSSEAKRAGGLWSASGMLSESNAQSVRMLILSIVYKAAGLSSDYGRARFRLWLRRRGWEDEVVTRILAEGLDVEEEFNNYLVSPIIADTVWELSNTQSMDADDAQARWEAQFNKTDVSVDEMTEALREVLLLQSENGKDIPLTLIVLDEAQQYIGENGTRAQALQEAVERIQSAFESKVLVVATGQAALNTTPNLQKLQGRFTVNVMLSDNDVEKVVRQVVLQKNPESKADVATVISQVEGEIDRHLHSTRIGPKSDDKSILVADYPLLPSRGRFWANLLHQLDPSGTSGQLRTQLRVVHSANVHVADRPLGHVIPGDFIFEQLQGGLQQSAVLPRDVTNMINDQDDGTEEGKLRARLIRLIFLIERLPSEDLNDIGLKATPDNLADLLVEDLQAGSSDLRRRIPEVLQKLEDDGRLMRASDGSYAIQTGESQKWQSEYQQQRQALVANSGPIGEIRSRVLEQLVRDSAKSLRRTHGTTKTARDVVFRFGNDTPDTSATDSSVVVWVRDEWNSSRTTVLGDARAAGDQSAIIYVFLPQKQSNDVREAIASYEASRLTLELRGGKQDSPDGQRAADNIRTRMNSNERRFQAALKDVIADAQVFQGGGSEVDGSSLSDKLQTAFDNSLKRLFPQFSEGDQLKWDTVFTRASEGSGDPLKVIGHQGDESGHPVIRQIRNAIPVNPGTTWLGVRKQFSNAPFGWPQDTIDGAVATLVNSGSVTAMRNGKEVRGKDLTRQQANQTQLFGESEVVSKTEILAARKAFQSLYNKEALDEDVRSGARTFLGDVMALHQQTGGEPPRPMSPMPAYLSEMQHQTGNTLIKSIAANAQQLAADIKGWKERLEEINRRMITWKMAEDMAAHAERLEGYESIRQSLDAIRDGRQLLDDPDPIVPVLQETGALLRAALSERLERHDTQLQAGVADLVATDEWQRIHADRQDAILKGHRLQPVSSMSISRDRDLLNALNHQTLSQWDDKIHSLSGRLEAASSEVARILEPSIVEVALTRPVLRKPIDVRRWVEETEKALMKHIDEGHPVRLK